MNKKQGLIKIALLATVRLATISLATIVVLAGCTAVPAPASTATPVVEQSPTVARTGNEIVAEAVIEPARWSELHLELGGEVVEVLAQEGARVAAGAPLLRVDTNELELSLQSAQQDVIAQQAALDRLLKGASEQDIARADKENADQIALAEIALKAAEIQLAKAQAEDVEADVALARARVEQLKLQLSQSRAQSPAPDIEAAQVELERSRIALDDTQNEYGKAIDRPWEDQKIRDGWAKQLEQAKLNYRAAQAQVNRTLNAQRAHTIALDVMAVQIQEVETQLAQAISARETYTFTLEALAVEVESARVRLEALQTWDNPYLDQATEEEIAQARVHLRQAELAVASLELKLQDAELRAPFDGTVVEAKAEVGDQVSPGQVVIVLATLDRLQARTTDLTELDVANIVTGQAATVSVDALPGREFDGVVSEVSLRAEDYRGDVVYAVTVALNDVADTPLRWGMTTMVKIGKP